ncbi:MAG: MFS transporter [Thermoplasmata archaeon]
MITLSVFLIIQSADTYVISAVVKPIMDEFGLNYESMGLLFTWTVVISTLIYPVWGYLYDKYSRKFLTTLLALILGSTTWMNAISRSFSQFFVTRLLTSTGLSVPSGIYTLTADYFEPQKRGTAMGYINAAAPIGYLLGIILPLSIIGAGLSWRYSFFVTGGLSLIVGFIIYFFVKEIPRGSSEPELAGKLTEEIYKVKFSDLIKILKNRSLFFLFAQSFFGTIPWTTISYWMITYMGVERKLAPDLISIIMLLWILFMVIGNIVSGYINDILFKKTLRGRVILGTIVVFLSAIFLYLTIYSISFEFFIIFGTITAFTIPMAGPSVNASILDVTEPELRGSATAYSNFFGGLGSSLGPFLAA